jgi:hypothetical protein
VEGAPLINEIYEAAILPEKWEQVLDQLKAASRNPRKIRLSCTTGFAGLAPRVAPLCHEGRPELNR